MLAHPFIEGVRDGFFTAGELGDVEDVTQEVGEGGSGLLEGLAQFFLGDEEVGTTKHGGDGGEIVI